VSVRPARQRRPPGRSRLLGAGRLAPGRAIMREQGGPAECPACRRTVTQQ